MPFQERRNNSEEFQVFVHRLGAFVPSSSEAHISPAKPKTHHYYGRHFRPTTSTKNFLGFAPPLFSKFAAQSIRNCTLFKRSVSDVPHSGEPDGGRLWASTDFTKPSRSRAGPHSFSLILIQYQPRRRGPCVECRHPEAVSGVHNSTSQSPVILARPNS